MKLLIVLAVTVLTVVAAANREEWINFKSQHGKFYHSIVEEKLRYIIFQDNLKKIQEHNKKFENGESSFKMGVNRFADMTVEEFRQLLGYRNPNPVVDTKREYFVPKSDHNIPDSFDWRKKGAVTGIKDQASCGSCWSFSATGTIEGQYFIKTGKLISLSEQNLVDCDLYCYGCSGGYMDKALEYVKENGIMLEKDYPYEAIDDKCRFNKTDIAVKLTSYVYVKKGDENALKNAVATVGPISVAIDATDEFQLYSSGVFDDSSCGNQVADMDHGVLVVGYGSQAGKDYWIVKNSWGTSWGQSGYIWMSRNKNNQCGIATEPIYPVV